MNTVIEQAEELDGPTAEFLQKHPVTARTGKARGSRIVSRLEALLRNGEIAPKSAVAGVRFARAWRIGCAWSQSASFARERVDCSGTGATDARHGAHEGYRRAAAALDADGRQYGGAAPSDIMVAFLIDELTFGAIAEKVTDGFLTDKPAKRLVIALLSELADYYAASDRKAGRSVVSETADKVLVRFEPEVADDVT